MNAPHIIILAAGKGTRMSSELPKVLHVVNGRPMIAHVHQVAKSVCERPSVVVGHRAGDVIHALGEGRYVVQEEQRGTGHAVRCALAAHEDTHDGSVIVIPGDHPFVTSETLCRLVAARESIDAAVALATVQLPDFEGPRQQFEGCGRVMRDRSGAITDIIERKEATIAEARVTEVNVSYYCFRGSWLKKTIIDIVPDNAAGEYYLTDLIALAFAQGERVIGVPLEDVREGLGVNTLEQLQAVSSF